MTSQPPHVAVLGGEPAALACAARLLREGTRVTHLYPQPWGLLGASREIGLAYPELGEPFERLEYALGLELASEFHLWGRRGIELLFEHAAQWEGLRRGSRLALTRNPQESALLSADALERGRRLGDAVRLMSGAAASNYAPVATGVDQAAFETHAAAFAPAGLSEYLCQRLGKSSLYRPVALSADEQWTQLELTTHQGEVRIDYDGEPLLQSDMVVVATGLEIVRLLDKFDKVLVPLLGQAFLTPPLREAARASVVGLSASWGHERYRFDAERRLLACAINPGAGEYHHTAVALPEAQRVLLDRARQIFADLEPEVVPEAMWGVLFTTTCDGLPLLGPLPGEPRVHLATGFSTSAWSRGYAAGDEVARCLAGATASPLMQRCSCRRHL